MSIGRTNASGGGTGATLTVTAPAGVTVTAAKGSKTYTRTSNAQGIAVFKGLETGVWDVTISDGIHDPASREVTITADYAVTIAFFAATISVKYPSGSVCTCTKGDVVLTAADTTGSYTFTVQSAGSWIVKSTQNGSSASQTVNITTNGESKSVTLSYRLTPEFTYSGTYKTVNDSGAEISDFANYKGNWKVRFLTSGNLKIVNLHSFDGRINVFLVGGGGGGSVKSGSNYGGGGGGGYTKTQSITLTSGATYAVTVGAGGGRNTGGGRSSFGSISVNGGGAGGSSGGSPGAGGSGAGGYGYEYGGDGGSNGSNGGTSDWGGGAKGQGTTTREFGESTGTLYAGGGGGGSATDNNKPGKGGAGGGVPGGATYNAAANTGGGGGGYMHSGGPGGTSGGSGIVIIRNAR